MSHQGGQRADRPRWTWLLVPAALLLSIGAGYPIGAAVGGDEPGPTPTAGPTGETPTDAPTDVVDGLDPCLVGTWRTTSHTEVYTDSVSGAGTLTQLDRTLVITPDGVETVSYADTPAIVTFAAGTTAQIQLAGSLVYRTTATAGVQTFVVESNTVTYTLTAPTGSQRFALQPGADAVQYTCDGDAYRQYTEAGYDSQMTRVDG